MGQGYSNTCDFASDTAQTDLEAQADGLEIVRPRVGKVGPGPGVQRNNTLCLLQLSLSGRASGSPPSFSGHNLGRTLVGWRLVAARVVQLPHL